MIKQIKLKNYILIDDLTVDFDKGLNVITGETGSGKSILINAIDIAFSNRVSKEVQAKKFFSPKKLLKTLFGQE